MKYRFFNKDLAVSEICLGGLHFGTYGDESETKRLIDAAIDRGINFIETAPMYGNGQSETLIGKAIANKKDRVTISTKVGLVPSIKNNFFSVLPIKMNRENITKSIDTSLKALGLDCIDLFQLHAFDYQTPILDICETLQHLVNVGKIKTIGISNHDAKEYSIVKLAMDKFKLPLVSFQCHFNMIERRAGIELIPMCGNDNVGVLCNRGLARGLLGGQYNFQNPVPDGSRASKSLRIKNLLNERTLNLISDLKKLSEEHGMSISQLATRWILEKKEVVSIALGMRTLDQINELTNSLHISYDQQLIALVDEVVAGHNLMWEVNAKPELFFEK